MGLRISENVWNLAWWDFFTKQWKMTRINTNVDSSLNIWWNLPNFSPCFKMQWKHAVGEIQCAATTLCVEFRSFPPFRGYIPSVFNVYCQVPILEEVNSRPYNRNLERYTYRRPNHEMLGEHRHWCFIIFWKYCNSSKSTNGSDFHIYFYIHGVLLLFYGVFLFSLNVVSFADFRSVTNMLICW